MTEIVFLIQQAPEGGYIARALGESIFTEAEALPELRKMIQDAVHCHFDEGNAPTVIPLHSAWQEAAADRFQ